MWERLDGRKVGADGTSTKRFTQRKEEKLWGRGERGAAIYRMSHGYL